MCTPTVHLYSGAYLHNYSHGNLSRSLGIDIAFSWGGPYPLNSRSMAYNGAGGHRADGLEEWGLVHACIDHCC